MYMEIFFWIMAVLSILGVSVMTSTKLTSMINKELGYWLWAISNLYFVFYFWQYQHVAVSIMFAVFFLIAVKSLIIFRYRR